MSNYTPPKDWPVIRWVALVLVGGACWWIARNCGRGGYVIVDRITQNKFSLLLDYMIPFYASFILLFRLVGGFVIVVIEVA